MAPKTSTASTPRIAAITPAQDLRVIVTWGAGPRSGRTEELDLSPILNSMKFFRPLREDGALFATVHTVDYGTAVAWGDEEIDLSAGAILRLAQETMRPEDMRAFIAAQGLTETSLAAILDYSRRQIVGFINEGRPIPRVVSLACRYIQLVNQTDESKAQFPPAKPRISVPKGFTVRGSYSSSTSVASAPISADVSTTASATLLEPSRLSPQTPQTMTDEQYSNAA